MQRLARFESGTVPILDARSHSELVARLEATKNLPRLSAYAMLNNASGYNEAVNEVMREVRRHTDAPVVLWGQDFRTFDVFGRGYPAVTEKTLELAELARVAGVIGFIERGKAEQIVALAGEKNIKIVFAGASQGGYLTAYNLGLRDFFLGYDQNHIDAMRRLMHNDSQFWVAPAREEEVLTTALASRSTRRLHVMVPSTLTTAEVQGIARRMTE